MPGPIERCIDDAKQPVPWLTWGADLRIRNEYFNDAQTLRGGVPLHEQDYFRIRARLWSAVTPLTNLNLNVRLTSEPRVWFRPASYTPFKGRSGTDMTYGVFEALNVQASNLFGMPASLSIGRQDLVLGDGWLLLEGTPNDGSWSVFIDSARLTYQLPEQHTTIDAIGIVHYAKDDTWLPTINSQDRYFMEQNEKGAVLNIANKSVRSANLDGYFIYKHDTRLNGKPGNLGDNGNIYTLGGRLSGLLGEHWKYSAEGAYQRGDKQDLNVQFPVVSTDFRQIDAFGVNAKLSYLSKDRLNDQVHLCYEYLSGDDPKTKTDEMFDVLWGRWPRWSELYNIYSYVVEARVGQTDNLHRLGPGWSFTPAKRLDFSANYFVLLADQETPTRASSLGLFSQDGIFRGHYIQAILKYQFSRHLRAHLWSEFVFPGDYYANHDSMTFLRGEVTLSF